VQFTIRMGNTDYSYLERRVESQGLTRQSANRHARELEYQAEIDSGSVELPLYYVLPDGEKINGQRVYLTLYLAVNDTVTLEPGLEEILQEVNNRNNYWSWDMVRHSWIMTPAGLVCVNCPESPNWEDEEAAESPTDSTAIDSGSGFNAGHPLQACLEPTEDEPSMPHFWGLGGTNAVAQEELIII